MAMTDRWADKQHKKTSKNKTKTKNTKILGGQLPPAPPPPPRGAVPD